MNSLQKIDWREIIHQQTNGLIIEFDSQFTNRSSSGDRDWNNMGITDMHPQQLFEPAKQSGAIIGRFESPASAFYSTEHYMGFPQYESQVHSRSINNEFQFSSGENFSIEPQEKIPVSNFSQVHYSSPCAHTSFSGVQEKQSPIFSCPGSVLDVLPPVQSSKTRIRWTQDLHEKFVECVNLLGGAEKATPKAVLKLMGTCGLTIFHVKSHLQKYRLAKYMPDPIAGKSDTKDNSNDLPQFELRIGLQIEEALKMQLDMQRSLHEQLEIQRNLQLRIEEQGKQLKKMFDEQQKNTNSLLQSHNLQYSSSNPTSLISTKTIEIYTPEEDSENNLLYYPSKIS